MELLLAHLRERHESAGAYVAAQGARSGLIEALRRELLEPAER
jgi:hypothetical protein